MLREGDLPFRPRRLPPQPPQQPPSLLTPSNGGRRRVFLSLLFSRSGRLRREPSRPASKPSVERRGRVAPRRPGEARGVLSCLEHGAPKVLLRILRGLGLGAGARCGSSRRPSPSTQPHPFGITSR